MTHETLHCAIQTLRWASDNNAPLPPSECYRVAGELAHVLAETLANHRQPGDVNGFRARVERLRDAPAGVVWLADYWPIRERGA